MKTYLPRLGQLVALWLSVFHIGPWVLTIWPDANPLLIEFASLVITGLVTELAIFLATPPLVTIEWHDERNPNELTELNVDSTRLLSGEVYLQLSTSGRGRSPLGRLALGMARRRGLSIRLDLPAAPVYIVVDVSTPVTENPARVESMPDGNGVQINLTHAPLPNTWVWARVLLQPLRADAIVTNTPFDVVVSRHASTKWGQACARVVKTRSSVTRVSLYR